MLCDGAGVVEEARRVAARVVDPLGWRHRQRLFRRFMLCKYRVTILDGYNLLLTRIMKVM